MKLKRILFKIAIITGLGAATMSCTRWHHATPEQKVERFSKKLSSSLDLTAAQQKQLDAIIQKHLPKVKEAKGKNKVIKQGLVADLENQKIDKAKLQAAVDTHKDTIDKLAPEVIEDVVAFYNALNKEQKQKVAKFAGHLKKWTDHN